MLRLLVVHHTVSPAMAELLETTLSASASAAAELDIDLKVLTSPALNASAVDVLGADGIILGSPINIGYMSGALKHFFDQIYYPCLADTQGLPMGVYLHGNSDAAGAVRGIERITTGLRWKAATQPVLVLDGVTASTKSELSEAASLVVAAIAEQSHA